MINNCLFPGMIGIGLLVASIATLASCKAESKKFKDKLPSDLDKVYDKIHKERRNQYIQGLIIGIVLSFFSLYFLKTSSKFYNITLFLTITLSITVFYYLLMPKSDYMLNHLTTPDENKAWLDIYKTMKFRYTLGFLLGLLSAIPFALTMC